MAMSSEDDRPIEAHEPLGELLPTPVRGERPKAESPTRVRWIVLGALCLATTFAYIDRGCISVAEKTIARDLVLDVGDMAWVISSFFVVYAVFQIPSGWLGQRWGSRLALSIFSFAWSLATGLAALANGFLGLLSSRVLMAIAEAGIFPCAANTLKKWFPDRQRARASGILSSFMGIGQAFGNWLTALILLTLSWRWMFLLYAIPGIVWAAWFWWWFRDVPRDHRGVNDAELREIEAGTLSESSSALELSEPTPWAAILTSVPFLLVCLAQAGRAGAFAFYLSFLPRFLDEARGVTREEMGVMSALPHVFATLGGILGGFVSDWLLQRFGSRWASRQGYACFASAAASGAVVVACFALDKYTTIALLSIGAFFIASVNPVVYVVTIDLGGKHVGPIFGWMNMAGNLGAFYVPPALVEILAKTGSWNSALVLLAGMLFVSAMLWLFVHVNRPIGEPAAKSANDSWNNPNTSSERSASSP